jgi:hypothetical protein
MSIQRQQQQHHLGMRPRSIDRSDSVPNRPIDRSIDRSIPIRFRIDRSNSILIRFQIGRFDSIPNPLIQLDPESADCSISSAIRFDRSDPILDRSIDPDPVLNRSIRLDSESTDPIPLIQLDPKFIDRSIPILFQIYRSG